MLTSWFPALRILAIETTALCVRRWCRMCASSWRILPQSWKVSPSRWHSNGVFKRPFYQISCFRMMGNTTRPVNSMIVGSFSDIICYEVSSLIRSNAILRPLPPNPFLPPRSFLSFREAFSSRLFSFYSHMPWGQCYVAICSCFILEANVRDTSFGPPKCKQTLIIHFSLNEIFFFFRPASWVINSVVRIWKSVNLALEIMHTSKTFLNKILKLVLLKAFLFYNIFLSKPLIITHCLLLRCGMNFVAHAFLLLFSGMLFFHSFISTHTHP